jgi:hypothetical protein
MDSSVRCKISGMKQRSLIAIIIFFLFASFFSSANDTTSISGRVINGKGYTIRLMAYNDQVSYTRVTLQNYMIGEDEKFTFSFVIDTLKYCWLDIEFQQAELFIQPGQNYNVEIELKDPSLTGSYYNRSGLPIKFVTDDSDHLNQSIQDFNQLYNDFLLDYAENINPRNAKPAYDNFMKAIELRFQNNKNYFFRDYITYKTASMQLFMRLKSRDNIGIEFIAGKPVLYENPEYMDFFHLFFEKYFITGGKYFTFNKAYDLINGGASFAALADSLKADPVLRDLEVRELLILDGLKDLYNISGFKRARILALINEVVVKGSTPESRMLAGNLLARLKRLQPGSPAPDFLLPGINTVKEYSLADFSGKLLYLAFFESGNPASQSELGLAADFYEDYKDKVAFVAVSVDKDLLQLKDYLARAGLPWLVLYYEGNLDLLENFDANTFPHFLLIDGKGQIIRCPAPSPSENIQKLFDSI